MKITFIGDIMCEPSVLKGAAQKDGSYDFRPMFEKVKGLLGEADYRIGNMEFPMAGEAAEYTKSYYCFNAPDAYADAVKDAGFDLISTVNNHTFDRGMDGLIRTLKVLDDRQLGHTGTWAPGRSREEAFYFTVGGTKFAVIAYTYATNFMKSPDDPRCVLAEGAYKGTVNLLRHQRGGSYLPGVYRKPDKIDKLTKKFLDEEQRGRLKILLGKEGNYARSDDKVVEEAMAPYMEQLQQDIRAAKEKADLVLCYPHMGGQFNTTPGKFSEYVTGKILEAGADAMLASHSHCIQKVELRGEVPCAFSMGNFSMSPNSSLMVPEALPGYGLAVHLYVEDKKIVKTTFSILKAVEKKRKLLVSWPVDELYAELKSEKEKKQLEQDVAKLLVTITGKQPAGNVIAREYIVE